MLPAGTILRALYGAVEGAAKLVWEDVQEFRAARRELVRSAREQEERPSHASIYLNGKPLAEAVKEQANGNR